MLNVGLFDPGVLDDQQLDQDLFQVSDWQGIEVKAFRVGGSRWLLCAVHPSLTDKSLRAYGGLGEYLARV